MSAAKVLLAPGEGFLLADLFVGVEKLAVQFNAEIFWNDQQAGGAWEAILGFRDEKARAAALAANHSDPGGWGFYMHPANNLVEGVHFTLRARAAPPPAPARGKKKEKKEAEPVGDKRADGSAPSRQRADGPAPSRQAERKPLPNGRTLLLPELEPLPVVNTFIHFAERTLENRARSAEACKRDPSVDAAKSGRRGTKSLEEGFQVASEKLASSSAFATPKRTVEENPLSPLRTPLPSLSPTVKHAMTQTPTSMLKGSLLGEGIRLAQRHPNATGYAFREEHTPERMFPRDFVTPLRQYRVSPVSSNLGQVDASGQTVIPASASGASNSDLDLDTPAKPAQRRRRGGRGRGLNKKDKEQQNPDQVGAAQVQQQRRMSDSA